MADRVISYDFRGNFSSLTAGLAAAGASVNAFGTKLTALDANGAKMRAGLTTMGGAAGKAGLAAAAGLGAIVLVSAKFDKAMSNVAATGEDARASLDELRQAALDAGAATSFSASEAASGVENLLKAGISAADVLGGGLAGALDLAAAGGLDVAAAAEIAATAMTQFSLGGEDVAHVADLLAAGAGKAQGDVSDMGMALKQSGLVASQAGLTIEETTGTLAAFASAGLIGSDAGTSFKTMLQSLTPTGDKAADAMRDLGITAYDAQGNFVGMTEFAASLQNGLKDLSVEQQNAAMKTIFGSDAVRAASVIFEQGAGGIQEWIDKVDDSGYAAETAGVKLDNLAGDWEALTGSIETALIGSGEGSTGIIREMVQGATSLTNAFNDLPSSTKNATTGLLAVTAVLGGGLWFTSKVINGIAAAKVALGQLGLTAQATSTKLAMVARSAGLIAVAFTAIDTGISILDAFGRSQSAADSTSESFKELRQSLEDSNVGEYADDFGIDLDRLAVEMLQFGDKGVYYAEVLDTMGSANDGFGGKLKQVGGFLSPFIGDAEKAQLATMDLGNVVEGLGDTFVSLKAGNPGGIWDAFYADTETAATATNNFSGALLDAADAADVEAKALRGSVKAMREKTDATLAAFDAETAYRQALKDAEAQAKKNDAGIRGSSEAALSNRAALSQLASAWNNQSEAVKNNGQRFREARSAFIDTAIAMKVPEAAAKRLADQIMDIPRSKAIKIAAETAAANAAIEETRRRMAAFNGTVATGTIQIIRKNVDTGMGPMTPEADGGSVPKTGKPYADRHPYLLADGEEVISNRFGQADRHRGLLKAINAGRLAGGGTAGGWQSSSGDNWAGNMSGLATFNDDLRLTGVFLRNELKARQALLTKEVEANKSRLEAIKAESDALRESVAQRFQSDIFAKSDQIQLTKPEGFADWDPAKQREFLEAEAAVNASMRQNPNDILRADIAAARKLMADLKELRRRGLDGAALANVATNADPGQIAALLSGSNAQLAEFESLYGTRQQVSQQAGQSAANFTGLTAELRAARAEYRESNTELKQLNRRMERMEKLAEKAPRETGQAVGAAVNGAATRGHKNRRP